MDTRTKKTSAASFTEAAQSYPRPTLQAVQVLRSACSFCLAGMHITQEHSGIGWQGDGIMGDVVGKLVTHSGNISEPLHPHSPYYLSL